MLQTVFSLIVFLFPLAYSPGLGNMFFSANGARFGVRATLPANLGYHLATWAITAAIGFGFLGALERFPQLFDIIRIGGSLYVLWIAWKLFSAGLLRGPVQPRPVGFVDGVVLLLFNPKAYVIIALVFSQFLGAVEQDRWATVLLITTVFTLNNLGAFLLWTVVGDRIAGMFRQNESAQKLNMLFGLLLATVAVWMLLS
ncbi:MAG: LysE family translocator [Rhodobacteraceae bacterium]|nr:LysE family translocator [Paracoccaceae bacterium]